MKFNFSILLCLFSAMFLGLTIGLFAGRNTAGGSVIVSQRLPAPTLSAEVSPTDSTASPDFPLNINTASEQELSQLPGIGEVLAQRIVAYRSANGTFRAAEELTKVSGIGEGKLESILDLITIGG